MPWSRRTPLTRSKINLIATQNSSKSRFPSLSTSAKSHIRSSCSSRSWLFFNTGAACAPVRCVPPLDKEANISQYFSISLCSIRLFDILLCFGLKAHPQSLRGVWDGGTEVWRSTLWPNLAWLCNQDPSYRGRCVSTKYPRNWTVLEVSNPSTQLSTWHRPTTVRTTQTGRTKRLNTLHCNGLVDLYQSSNYLIPSRTFNPKERILQKHRHSSEQ